MLAQERTYKRILHWKVSKFWVSSELLFVQNPRKISIFPQTSYFRLDFWEVAHLRRHLTDKLFRLGLLNCRWNSVSFPMGRHRHPHRRSLRRLSLDPQLQALRFHVGWSLHLPRRRRLLFSLLRQNHYRCPGHTFYRQHQTRWRTFYAGRYPSFLALRQIHPVFEIFALIKSKEPRLEYLLQWYKGLLLGLVVQYDGIYLLLGS
mmetsp:Transcript_26238/g.38875  ORF Transcript_26238/g.38875 Transcript_26238/m.38875 type:complete len:204 (+) Transcript_26238:459-1070(+)